MSESKHTEDSGYQNPIIGSPSKEELIRAISDESFRDQLCEQYGADKIEQLVNNTLNM